MASDLNSRLRRLAGLDGVTTTNNSGDSITIDNLTLDGSVLGGAASSPNWIDIPSISQPSYNFNPDGHQWIRLFQHLNRIEEKIDKLGIGDPADLIN